MKKFSKIYVEITNSCNFKCSFCGVSNREIKFMTIEEFRKIAEDVVSYTDLITLHVKGEPLLHPNLNEILNICLNVGLKVNITTNGSLLLKNVNVLKNLAVRQLNISLHSINKNVINTINKEEYIDNIFKAVDILKENNPKLYISYRLWNLKDINLNSENYYLLERISKKYNINDLINKSKENLFVELANGIFLNQDLEFKWPYMTDDVLGSTGTCLGLRNQIGILSNGNVVPCCLDQDGIICLGNIFESNLKNILNSELSKNIIQGFENNRIVHDFCKRCTYRERFNK